MYVGLCDGLLVLLLLPLSALLLLPLLLLALLLLVASANDTRPSSSSTPANTSASPMEVRSPTFVTTSGMVVISTSYLVGVGLYVSLSSSALVGCTERVLETVGVGAKVQSLGACVSLGSSVGAFVSPFLDGRAGGA